MRNGHHQHGGWPRRSRRTRANTHATGRRSRGCRGMSGLFGRGRLIIAPISFATSFTSSESIAFISATRPRRCSSSIRLKGLPQCFTEPDQTIPCVQGPQHPGSSSQVNRRHPAPRMSLTSLLPVLASCQQRRSPTKPKRPRYARSSAARPTVTRRRGRRAARIRAAIRRVMRIRITRRDKHTGST